MSEMNNPPRLTVSRTSPQSADSVWRVMRDLFAWYWPDPFHSLPTMWTHRLSDGDVTVHGIGVWMHAYLPIFPWRQERVGFSLDVDDVLHVVRIVEMPVEEKSAGRHHTQAWSVTATGNRDCTVRVDLWHAPVPLIGWYTSSRLSSHAERKLDHLESIVLSRAP